MPEAGSRIPPDDGINSRTCEAAGKEEKVNVKVEVDGVHDAVTFNDDGLMTSTGLAPSIAESSLTNPGR